MRLTFLLASLVALHAESGADAWLRYAPLDEASARQYNTLPAAVATFTATPPAQSAQHELLRGVRGMLGRTLRVESGLPKEPAILLGTLADFHQSAPQLALTADLPLDGYWLTTASSGGVTYTVITAANDRGVLYGTFAFLRKIALAEPVAKLDEKQSPYAPVRWVNEWNNLDGTIERGYGGRSIFWDKLQARDDLTRVGEYGRLLASLGINACSINNVNANPRVLAADFIPQVVRIAEAFRPWGVRVALAVDFGSPKTLGGLDTFDPLDARVASWWKDRVDALYAAVPDLAGFVLKADSEGRVGPATYGRTHADAANLLARALQPHHGLLFYRGFVYDHHADWTNPKNDRGRAAYDNFQPLDGKFDDNVIVQIKHGPIDFQVREPASPLFGALEKTNQAIELQITQEYFGQSRHTVFLVPMWKEALDFDMHVREGATPVKALVAGKTFRRPTGGFVGVSNVGLDENWYGNHMSQANLYGFGRLAWNPDLSAQRIIDEWTRLTFGNDPKVVETINSIQLTSWRTFENYTGPLGLANAHRYCGRPLRSRGGGIGTQRLGTMAQRRRKGSRDGANGRQRHRLHRTVQPHRGQNLRVSGDLSRRPAALPPPRSVHLQTAFREDGDPIPIRFALRGVGGRCRVGTQLENAARPHRRPALHRGPEATGVSGRTHRGLARCGQRLVPSHFRHR